MMSRRPGAKTMGAEDRRPSRTARVEKSLSKRGFFIELWWSFRQVQESSKINFIISVHGVVSIPSLASKVVANPLTFFPNHSLDFDCPRYKIT
jgi:hypothetical protein